MKTILICLTLLTAAGAFAQPQQSANFRITKSVLDAGGAPSTSANFHLVSAFGQPTPIGISSSANFVLSAGFLTPSFAASPASPIDVVIKREIALSNDMNLNWTAIPGATSYVIFRDVTPTFTPSPANQVGTSGTNSFTDLGAVGLPALKYFYIVEAVGSAVPAAAKSPDGQIARRQGAQTAKMPVGSSKPTGSPSGKDRN